MQLVPRILLLRVCNEYAYKNNFYKVRKSLSRETVLWRHQFTFYLCLSFGWVEHAGSHHLFTIQTNKVLHIFIIHTFSIKQQRGQCEN
jgi:hypothetical protein